MSAGENVFAGSCHCGAIGFTYHASREPGRWAVRACQCSFCRAHGARTTSDPDGFVVLAISDETKLARYRFGTRSADFLICRECGVYLAALLTTARGQFATLNVNTMRDLDAAPEATPASYDGESVEQKLERREKRWTPVARSA